MESRCGCAPIGSPHRWFCFAYVVWLSRPRQPPFAAGHSNLAMRFLSNSTQMIGPILFEPAMITLIFSI
jgi:hypothetical protein